MKKIAILLGLAAVLTTGLMADKCTYAPQQTGDEQKTPDAPATTEPAPAPTTPPAQ